MTPTSSNMVRALVMRELEQGVRQDGLWLQALSESKLDPAQTKLRYIELRVQALQSEVKGLLVSQIKGAVAQDQAAKRADFLSLKDLVKPKK